MKIAMDIHDELSEFLSNRRTFFDYANPLDLKIPDVPDEERKDPEPARPFDATVPLNTQEKDLENNPIPALSSFDILVYAYLKEALTNTSESREVAHLKSKNNLKWFMNYMNLIMDKELDHLGNQANNSNKLSDLITDHTKLS
jgi:hypothetical protein